MPSRYDAICIGGGPSGLMAALELARAGGRVALLERGGDMIQSLCPRVGAHLGRYKLREAERFRFQCARCTCLQGLGGAAFHFDTNLGYFKRLSRSKVERSPDGGVKTYSGLERALGSFERADRLIKEVYETFFAFGVPRQHEARDAESLEQRPGPFTHVDTADSQPVTVRSAIDLIAGITSELSARGAAVLLHTDAETIDGGSDLRWRVHGRRANGDRLEIEANAVIIGVGKSALVWLLGVLKDLQIDRQETSKVDIGVRIETWRRDMLPVVRGCHNPKFAFLNSVGDSVRTFCVCDGGRLMQYEFAGVTVLDGQHCLKLPTNRTNFGVVTTVSLESSQSGTEFALAYARRVNELGDGQPVVQSLGDLLGTPGSRNDGQPLTSSLIHYAEADLRDCLPEGLVEDIDGMVERLNELAPGSIGPCALVAAPVVERLYPAVELTTDMETSAPGIFLVGDCSSKIMGITYGAATGMAAARAVIARA